jgi:hypothetical protein
MLGYISAGQFATTGSNIFVGGQIIMGNITIAGDIFANTFNVTTTSISHFSASTNFGLDEGDTHIFTGSVYITGSLNVIGGINGVINATNGVVSSSAQITSFGFVSGSYETTGRGIISGSISYNDLTNIPQGIASGSYETTGRSIVSSSAQITAFGFISSSQTIDTGSFATTGSNLFRGDETITGSLFISGTTELGGNIVPKTARGATLGTLERPFSEIFVSSGSINIAGNQGDPNTTLTNIDGNILVSAGGMRLIGDASFIAATASFQYLSGSFTHIGAQFNIGNIITTGSLQVSGSTVMVGNNTMQGNTLLSGSFGITGSTSFSELGNTSLLSFSSSLNSRIISATNEQSFNGLISSSAQITSFGFVSGSYETTGRGIISSSAQLPNGLVSGSSQLTSSLDLRYAVTGSNVFTAGQTITGSVTITGSIVMDGTAQTYFSHTVTNPTNYVLHQFLTSSYRGGTYAFSVHNDSTGKATVYSNYIIAQGANAINSNIGGDSVVTSGAGAPNPSFTVGFSSGSAQFKVTDTGTFTYRGLVQIY